MSAVLDRPSAADRSEAAAPRLVVVPATAAVAAVASSGGGGAAPTGRTPPLAAPPRPAAAPNVPPGALASGSPPDAHFVLHSPVEEVRERRERIAPHKT
jgi:hypothetical protein